MSGNLIPDQTIVTKLLTVSVYTIVRHGKEMSEIYLALFTIWGFIPVLRIVGVLVVGGLLEKYGVKVLESWKYHDWGNKRDKKLMGKFRKSCKPLTLHYQKIYTVKRLTVLKFLRGLTRAIMRVLLAL